MSRKTTRSVKRSNKKVAAKKNGKKAPVAGANGHSRRGAGVRIAPSLLAANFALLRDQVKPLKGLSVNWLHLDIMDGHFVPNISFGPDVVRDIREIEPSLYFDVHLMIDNPRSYVKQFVDAGAQNITFHVEAAGDDTANLLKYIRRHDCHAGICIKPRTKVDAIVDVLKYADLVLVMTVEPGFGGQELIPSTLNKVRELALIREEDRKSVV